MGLFGVSEVLENVEEFASVEVFRTKVKGLLPNLKDWGDSIFPIIRGSFLGFMCGLIPGAGVTVAGFASYAMEKKISKHPEKFGTGIIEGVAGPESANNGASSGNFVPLFTLGIPCGASTALLFGALMIHGLQPGPLLIKQHPDVFWGTIMSMYIGNVFLLILNLPLIGLWVRLLRIPYGVLFPFILLFCIIGSYTISYNLMDVLLMIFFGFLGYILRKFKYEPAPLVMAFVLGPILEKSLRQSLLMASGNFLVFLTRPISLFCLVLTACLLLSSLFFTVRKRIAAESR
jgi:putative tricarboxylic transport membrane protein